MIKFREKQYTKYDETDHLKQMRDSDILAQKKRSNWGLRGQNVADAAIGAAAGAVIGSGVGMFKKGTTIKSGGKYGALIGGGLAGAISLAKTRQQKRDNNFYNNRLEYAQRHARRRERADWKNNNLNREGYTY